MIQRSLLSNRFSINSVNAVSINQSAKNELSKVFIKIQEKIYHFEERCCTVCGGDNFLILAEIERYGLPIKKAICKGCGLVQTNPDMREQDYIDFYKTHYRDLYIADLVGSPDKFYAEEKWRGQAIFDFLTRHVKLELGSLVVEVGCGAGGIISVFKNEGYRVIGVDYGAVNLAYARQQGLEVYEGGINDLCLTERPALIIYSHVLEHVQNIDAELTRVFNILADDGVVYIEVPGIRNVRWNSYQADLLKTFHIAHIYDFSLNALCNMLEKNRFKLIYGNEYIRSVFSKSNESKAIVSDFEATYNYLKTTERFYYFFGSLSRILSRVQSLMLALRGYFINFLHRLGLYEKAKAAYRHYQQGNH